MTPERRVVVTWLEREGFQRIPRTNGGHLRFERGAQAVVLVAPGHAPKQMNPRETAILVRTLERLGYDRAALREAWGVS